ncbi:PIN domain-containing protein [Georgenia sp. MJ170]|uniref:PIN domain-containing protein n=1 Tax=Georgenia sunbinii TaxID=3117728 RepID=UPI002F25F8FD
MDTNVIAYQFDAGEPVKQERARQLLTAAEHDFVISTQVLLELFVVVTRKLTPPLPHTAASRVLAALAELPVVTTDGGLVQRAVATVGRHQLSIWDALILEAAVESGCAELWTEDLATGSVLRGVAIVDPFG